MRQAPTPTSPHQPGEPAEALTFAWPNPERWYQSRLLRFLAVSVLGHLLAFQLFQVVTQEKVTAPERERELQFLSSDNPDHQTFLQAVESEVPLAALSHQLLATDGLQERPYQSAFAESRITPKEPARWSPAHAQVIPKFEGRTPSSPAPSLSAAPFPGKIIFSASLQDRLSMAPPFRARPLAKFWKVRPFLWAFPQTAPCSSCFWSTARETPRRTPPPSTPCVERRLKRRGIRRNGARLPLFGGVPLDSRQSHFPCAVASGHKCRLGSSGMAVERGSPPAGRVSRPQTVSPLSSLLL